MSDPALSLEPTTLPASPVVDLSSRRRRKVPQRSSEPVLEPQPQVLHTYEIRVRYDQLVASDLNYRLVFDPAYIEELAEDIASQGLLQNLLARPAGDTLFDVFAGGCRFRALQLLVEKGRWSLEEANIPLQVREGLTDADLILMAMSENSRRRDTHWLEDARGVANAVRAMTGDAGPARGDGVTAAIAARLQKTQRWIQILWQLEQDLHPDVKAFFLDHPDLSIELAKAVRGVPGERQLVALEHIKTGLQNGWHLSPDSIRRALVANLPSTSKALFSAGAYDGPMSRINDDSALDDTREPGEDPDTEPESAAEYFLDPEQFMRLQEEAIDAKREELAQQYAFADIVRTDRPYDALNGYLFQPGPDAGAVLVVLPDLSVRVETGYVRKADILPSEGGEPIRPATEPVTKGHFILAHRMKTAALQRRLIGSPVDSMRVAILALLGHSAVCRMETGQIIQADLAVDPCLLPSFNLLAERFGPLLLSPTISPAANSGAEPLSADSLPHFSFGSHDTDAKPERAVKVLAALPNDEVEQLFCTLVAARTGSFCDINPRAGDRPAAIALAAVTGANVEEMFLERSGLTDTFLKGYRKPHLLRIAQACGISDEDLGGLTMSQLRERILAAPGRVDFFPPELGFGTDKHLSARLEKVGATHKKTKKNKKTTRPIE
jgi:ParB-like nuclease domain